MASQAADARARAGWLRGIGAVHEESWTAPDVRRRLQLVLAGIWLLDAVLQFQAFMFSRGFSQMLVATAAGNPAVIADPINWSAKIIAGHGTLTNAVFAFIQLAIGLGIAWRPTLKLALGASIVWSLGVWWFGEGLGGVLNGAGGPANGAPGAVIIYALLAVLLWPGSRDRAAPFVAGRFTGPDVARALWLVLWGSLAYLALLPATRAPKALGGMVSGMASGQCPAASGWSTLALVLREVVDVSAASPLTDAAPATAEFEFVIGGMTCAACAVRVQAKLNKVDGVTATVNLATERAHITAPAPVSARELINVIEAAGYSARRRDDRAVQAPGRRRGRAAGRPEHAARAAGAAPGAGKDRRRGRPAAAAVAVRGGDAGRRPCPVRCLLRR